MVIFAQRDASERALTRCRKDYARVFVRLADPPGRPRRLVDRGGRYYIILGGEGGCRDRIKVETAGGTRLQ